MSAARAADASAFSWKYLLITIVGAVAIASGLFFAATRHFSSMELGIMNAKIRNQLQELKNEKRRLELEREVAMTPNALKRTARTLGFTESAMLTKSAEPSTSGATETSATIASFVSKESTELKSAVERVKSSKPVVESEKKIAFTVAKQSPPKGKDAIAKPLPVGEGGRPRIVPVADRGKATESNGIRRTNISMPTNRSAQSRPIAKFD